MEQGLELEVEGKDNNIKGLKALNARLCFGAVYAYWRCNAGSAWALKWWESKMIKDIKQLHIISVIELCEGFRHNRTHHRSHLKDMITHHLKPMMMEKWIEVEYNQRMLFNLMKELEHLDYWDKDIWQKIFDTINHKKWINNITYVTYWHQLMKRVNEDPQSAFF